MMNVASSRFSPLMPKRVPSRYIRNDLKRDGMNDERNVKTNRGNSMTCFALLSSRKKERGKDKSPEMTTRCMPESAKICETPFSLPFSIRRPPGASDRPRRRSKTISRHSMDTDSK